MNKLFYSILLISIFTKSVPVYGQTVDILYQYRYDSNLSSVGYKCSYQVSFSENGKYIGIYQIQWHESGVCYSTLNIISASTGKQLVTVFTMNFEDQQNKLIRQNFNFLNSKFLGNERIIYEIPTGQNLREREYKVYNLSTGAISEGNKSDLYSESFTTSDISASYAYYSTNKKWAISANDHKLFIFDGISHSLIKEKFVGVTNSISFNFDNWGYKTLGICFLNDNEFFVLITNEDNVYDIYKYTISTDELTFIKSLPPNSGLVKFDNNYLYEFKTDKIQIFSIPTFVKIGEIPNSDNSFNISSNSTGEIIYIRENDNYRFNMTKSVFTIYKVNKM